MFRAAVAAVEPGRLVGKALCRSASGLTLTAGGVSSGLGWDDLRKIYLVGGGKAARAMGEAAMRILGERVGEGVLAVPRGGGGGAGARRFVAGGVPPPRAGRPA